MATYILLSTLTPEGRRTLHSDPDRLELEQVNEEISEFGCKVLAQYAVLGLYDFVTVVEAADNETVAHLALDLGSRGNVNIVTLPAIPTSELRDKLKSSKEMGRHEGTRCAGGHSRSKTLAGLFRLLRGRERA